MILTREVSNLVQNLLMLGNFPVKNIINRAIKLEIPLDHEILVGPL